MIRGAIIGALAAFFLAAAPARAVPVQIVYADGPNEGFHDLLLGAVRRTAFEVAAGLWAASLGGNVPVVIRARMEPLGGGERFAPLGYTSATTVHADFPGAPMPNTWYAASLANQLSGVDLNGDEVEIEATFNSDVDGPSVLGSLGWSYGLDLNPLAAGIDFVSTALHELGHGFNFFDLVDPSSGRFLDDRPDIFSRHLFRPAVGRFDEIGDFERASALVSDDVFWNGPHVQASHAGPAKMYAPNPYQGGSSISHWDTSLAPDELMEPFDTGPLHALGLSSPAMRDMGWPAVVSLDRCEGRSVTIAGTLGNDVLDGTAGPDVIHGRAGDDVIRGRGGNDVICGGSGNDVVTGGRGNDVVRGGAGDDLIRGGDGDDVLRGGKGSDVIRGGAGTDQCVGEAGDGCE